MMRLHCFSLPAFGMLAVAVLVSADEPKLPTAEPVGKIEAVATFDGPMLTGVTVSQKGRIFVNFPRWGDPVDFTVAELKDGQPVAYPDTAFNRLDKGRPDQCLVSVQSVVVDPDDRLWLLDTGSVEFGPTLPGGPKLVGVDLKTNKVFKTIPFPEDVALKTTYLNDVRFDLRRGKAGVAYITDSSLKGANGLIVVDLESGKSWRRLHDHPSTKADKNFLPIVEGRPLMNRPKEGKPTHMTFGSDGIAISHDGQHLYYCPLSSRRLYRVRTDALMEEKAGDAEVAKAVEDLGDRGFASDGLESDDKGRLYLTNYEDNAVLRRGAAGRRPPGSYPLPISSQAAATTGRAPAAQTGAVGIPLARPSVVSTEFAPGISACGEGTGWVPARKGSGVTSAGATNLLCHAGCAYGLPFRARYSSASAKRQAEGPPRLEQPDACTCTRKAARAWASRKARRFRHIQSTTASSDAALASEALSGRPDVGLPEVPGANEEGSSKGGEASGGAASIPGSQTASGSIASYKAGDATAGVPFRGRTSRGSRPHSSQEVLDQGEQDVILVDVRQRSSRGDVRQAARQEVGKAEGPPLVLVLGPLLRHTAGEVDPFVRARRLPQAAAVRTT